MNVSTGNKNQFCEDYSVSSEDFKRIILILALNDWWKNFRTKYENRMEN